MKNLTAKQFFQSIAFQGAAKQYVEFRRGGETIYRSPAAVLTDFYMGRQHTAFDNDEVAYLFVTEDHTLVFILKEV